MTAAAIAIILALTGIWVLVVQRLLPTRIKWRVVGLALALGALSPLPEGAAPLVQYRLERDGEVWTWERALAAASAAAPRVAPTRRRPAGKP